jgi:hypothetical protein
VRDRLHDLCGCRPGRARRGGDDPLHSSVPRLRRHLRRDGPHRRAADRARCGDRACHGGGVPCGVPCLRRAVRPSCRAPRALPPLRADMPQLRGGVRRAPWHHRSRVTTYRELGGDPCSLPGGLARTPTACREATLGSRSTFADRPHQRDVVHALDLELPPVPTSRRSGVERPRRSPRAQAIGQAGRAAVSCAASSSSSASAWRRSSTSGPGRRAAKSVSSARYYHS